MWLSRMVAVNSGLISHRICSPENPNYESVFCFFWHVIWSVFFYKQWFIKSLNYQLDKQNRHLIIKTQHNGKCAFHTADSKHSVVQVKLPLTVTMFTVCNIIQSAVNSATASTKSDLTCFKSSCVSTLMLHVCFHFTFRLLCKSNKWMSSKGKFKQVKVMRKHWKVMWLSQPFSCWEWKSLCNQISEYIRNNIFAQSRYWAQCKRDCSCISVLCSPPPHNYICVCSSWL